tara:strand:+ start:232 stop:873 length:642 start_codon:yes stop_codon:yes gene_type:complete
MSRLRKGKKFKGGSFAETFKQGVAMKTPFSKVVVAGEQSELPTSDVDGAAAAATEAAKSSPTDIIPGDTDYSREEIGAYFQRRKLAKEKEELEKLKESQTEDPTTPAADEGTIGFSDDYDDTDTAKSIRQENRQNKKEIRQAAKAQKKDAKQNFKDAKAAAKQLKGKDKRQAKKAARQDKRADKKSIRQSKKAAKKSNRAKKRAAKKARKGRK